MQHRTSWMVLIPLVALPLWSCQPGGEAESYPPPARVEAIEGTGLNRVILTQQASDRLGLQTVPVDRLEGPGPATSAVPYGAVIYGAEGGTWVYTTSENLTFVRHAISVESIEGDIAYLSDGPDAGTEVVSVGCAELFGTEFGGGQ